jgi:hypothetical protein
MKSILVGAISVALLCASTCFAGVRHFTSIYEAPTSAPGSLELENWVTWKRGTSPERSDTVEFRHELGER